MVAALNTIRKKISLALAFIYTPIAKSVIGLGNLITARLAPHIAPRHIARIGERCADFLLRAHRA